jgi:hypothetical protein
MRLPDEFLRPFYHAHRKWLLELVEKEQGVHKVFLELTRVHPCVITYGSEEYPNGAIKSVGFVPKKEYLEQTIKAYRDFVLQRWDKIRAQKPVGYEGSGWRLLAPRDQQVEAWKLMLREIYLEPEEAERKIDFTKLATLEGFYTHTWSNVKKNNKACLLYWLPPSISFEIRCTVEIHEDGPYKEFLNLAACLTHGENPSKWKIQPAYIFNVETVFDNSITSAHLRVRSVPF